MAAGVDPDAEWKLASRWVSEEASRGIDESLFGPKEGERAVSADASSAAAGSADEDSEDADLALEDDYMGLKINDEVSSRVLKHVQCTVKGT